LSEALLVLIEKLHSLHASVIKCYCVFFVNLSFSISLAFAVGREEESAGVTGADMQSNRGGFAHEAADIAPGEELEGNKYRDERQVAAGRETRTQQPAR